ncbi:hypothetical protein P692DRAFT_20875990 [Suillus brevipes Sb2]|nr:hypothetical protein P692DRAFT_20875990 [Suillus brevipes Sb2]
MRVNAPPNLPVTHPWSAGAVNGPPPGHVTRKRKPESGSTAIVTKRPRQVKGGPSSVPREPPFLDPFRQPTAGPPRAFEPEFTVAESEELTRRLQDREFAREISREAEEDVENTVEDYDDEDPCIDPDLENIPAPEDDEGQPPLQPLAHPGVQPFIPSGWTSSASYASTMTPSWPASATPSMRESTPISDFFTSHASSVTPASSLFNLGQHRQAAQPAKTFQAANQSFRTPAIPSNCKTGFSTGTESESQRRPYQSAPATVAPRSTSTCKTAAELEPQVQYLIEQNEILREIVDKHHSEIVLLNKTVAAQSGSLEELLTLIHDRRGSDTGVLSVKSVDKATKAVRDNIFNHADFPRGCVAAP